MKKIIITCAVTGAETTTEQNPALPVTPEEIARASADACAAGASIIHLHVRDEKGRPTQDADTFRRAIGMIEAECDAVIEVTTGGAVGMSLEERLAPLKLHPEMASLDCGTVNFGDDYIVNTLPMMRRAAAEMKEKGIKPTLECFDLSHLEASKVLIREGLVEGPYYYGLVLGVPGGLDASLSSLAAMVDRLPPGSLWTAIGIGGRGSISALAGALAGGGNIRTGFEDNVYYAPKTLARDNAQLVERAARVTRELGFEIATPRETREALGLCKARSKVK